MSYNILPLGCLCNFEGIFLGIKTHGCDLAAAPSVSRRFPHSYGGVL